MREVTLGFLGCGNIGCGVFSLLQEMEKDLRERDGIAIKVLRVLVRDVTKKRAACVPQEALTTSPEEIIENPDIDIVMEFLGGEQPAADYMRLALEAGKTVITANKMALASHWQALHTAAQKSGAGLYYEASACAAIPIIRTLTESLQANRVDELYGIINGTTNYILTRMANEGAAFRDVLYDAQRLGLAEPDPTADVEGMDAAYKLSILSTLAFRRPVPVGSVVCRGITSITPEDIEAGRDMGYALKLMAVAKQRAGTVQARVYPTFVPLTHPLASVSGPFNAVYLKGHACGEMMLYGRGAGDMPTASAIVSDLVVATHAKRHASDRVRAQGAEVPEEMDWESRFFIRMSVIDKPGVLGKIAGIMGKHGISIASMRQEGGKERVPLLLVTHMASDRVLHEALDELESESTHVVNVIYVEDMNGY